MNAASTDLASPFICAAASECLGYGKDDRDGKKVCPRWGKNYVTVCGAIDEEKLLPDQGEIILGE